MLSRFQENIKFRLVSAALWTEVCRTHRNIQKFPCTLVITVDKLAS